MFYACDGMGINEFILLYILLISSMLGFTMLQKYFKSKTPKSIILFKRQSKPPKQTEKIKIPSQKTPTQPTKKTKSKNLQTQIRYTCIYIKL